MNIGIFLGIGESLKQMEISGQKDRFVNLYLKRYAKNFDKVYLFSYENESYSLPKNIILVPKRSSLHRYLYAFLIPIVNRTQIKDCDVIRGFGLTSSIPALLTTKPFVFNFPYDYSEFLKIEKKYLFIPLFWVLERLAFLKAKYVLIATTKKFKTLKGQKFIYLPNGVDVTLFAKKGNLGKGIVFVGRLEKQKNLFFLIEVVSKLPKHLRYITFIGSGSLKTSLENYAFKKKVSLTIKPPVENTKLPTMLSRFSIFVLPSLAEGSPKVLLEAMAIGLVPVVTNFSTAKEFIKNNVNGFITNYDENNFPKNLKLLLEDDKLRAKISKNAKETIKNNFNQNKLINFEISVLQKAVLQ